MPVTKNEKADIQVAAIEKALWGIGLALAEDRPVDLADAKALEAAGCWFRRNMISVGDAVAR